MNEGEAQTRLQFRDFDFRRLTNSRCQARVVLASGAGDTYVGRSEEVGSEAGELRCAAQAALDSIGQAVGKQIGFELLGVKAVRAFDATVVIVSIICREEDQARRLVGSFLAEDHSPRGAALAVLNATNRLLGNIFMRDLRE